MTVYSNSRLSSAIGAMRNESRVLSAPFKLKSCDQVVEIQDAKTLTDVNDFTKKESRFFTMSIYMINEFKEKNSTSLLESIPLDSIQITPSLIHGSVGCILFSGNNKSIYVCLDSEEKAQNLLIAFSAFMGCRRGENLNNNKTASIMNILRSSCKKYFYLFKYLEILNL